MGLQRGVTKTDRMLRGAHRPPLSASAHSYSRALGSWRSGDRVWFSTTGTRSNIANSPSGNLSARYFSFSSRTLASVRHRTAPNTPRLNMPLQMVRVRLTLKGLRRRAM